DVGVAGVRGDRGDAAAHGRDDAERGVGLAVRDRGRAERAPAALVGVVRVVAVVVVVARLQEGHAQRTAGDAGGGIGALLEEPLPEELALADALALASFAGARRLELLLEALGQAHGLLPLARLVSFALPLVLRPRAPRRLAPRVAHPQHRPEPEAHGRHR